jgi:hypothetical protein
MIILKDKLYKKIKKFRDYKLVLINKKYKWEFKISKTIVLLKIFTNFKIFILFYKKDLIIIIKD